MRKTISAGLAFAAAAAALAMTAPAASADWATTKGDVNGYSTDEKVTVRDVDSNTHELVVTFTSGRVDRYQYQVRADTPVRTPRITDINGDGRDEVVVLDNKGMFNDYYRILVLRPDSRWITVKGSDSKAFHLLQSRSTSNVRLYACHVDQLLTLAAHQNEDDTYTGSLAYYDVSSSGVLDYDTTTRFVDRNENAWPMNLTTGSCRG